MLRPEVVTRLGELKAIAILHGVEPTAAGIQAARTLGISMYQQATVLSFDRVFMFQGILFLFVIPLLFFLRVPRVAGQKVHVELPGE
jgi:hypothetical protein